MNIHRMRSALWLQGSYKCTAGVVYSYRLQSQVAAGCNSQYIVCWNRVEPYPVRLVAFDGNDPGITILAIQVCLPHAVKTDGCGQGWVCLVVMIRTRRIIRVYHIAQVAPGNTVRAFFYLVTGATG